MDEKKDVMIPEIPDMMDVGYIKTQLISIQDATNEVQAYFRSLKAKFRSKQQKRIILELEEWHQLITAGLKAQTRAHNAKLELDIARDPEMQELKKLDAKLALQAGIARRQAQIDEYINKGSSASPQKPTREDVRQHKVNNIQMEIDDYIAVESAKNKGIDEIDREMEKALQQVMQDRILSNEVKQEKQREIRKRYARIKNYIKSK